MRYTLMCKEHEVLEFDIDLSTGAVHDVQPLEGIAWAPLGVLDYQGQMEQGLCLFIDDRSISESRADLPAILEATGAQTAIELAFRAGGFSLSDPYWYRAPDSALTWTHGNFFANEWDPAFGEAALREDYRALGKASPSTPDVTCSGSCRKAWMHDAEGPLLLKASIDENDATVASETLVSLMLSRLLPENEFVQYELVERDGEIYSASRPIVNGEEELAMAWQALSAAQAVHDCEKSAAELLGFELLEDFGVALERLNVEGRGQAVVKTAVIAHLILNNDMHPHNLGVIRAVGAGALRLAPFFDFDRAFGLSNRDRMEWACTKPEFAILIMASRFSRLVPSWDYSWYDPHALDGFEGEIVRALSAVNAGPEGSAELIARMFAEQRTYVNRVACGN